MNSRTSKAAKPFVHYLYRLLSWCSLGCLFSLSRLLGSVVARAGSRTQGIAEANLNLCFPGMSHARRTNLVKQSIQHTLCALFELGWAWYQPINRVLQRFDESEVDPHFHQSTRGKIIIAPHHGSWELLNLWLADQGQLVSLYKPAENERIDRFILASRGRNGAQLVPISTPGLRRLLRALKGGAQCMILPDQRPGPNSAGLDVPFFGIPAPTSLLVSNICRKVDCDIYMAAALRRIEDVDYALKIVRLDRQPFLQDDYQSARYLNACIEAFIETELEQYQWIYRRFDRDTYQSLEKDR